MADAKQFNDPKSVSPKSTPERRDGDECVSGVEAGDRQPASAPLSQSRPPVRRSSLRPAPADYRPSVRDPSTLRPMMVVRAGDAAPTPAHQDISDPAASRRSKTPADGTAISETFALTADLTVNIARDGTSPLVIPRPPAVPIDLVPKTDVHQQPLQDVVTVAPPVSPELETLPTEAAAATSTDPNPALIASCDTATTSDLREPEGSNSTPGTGHATSKRQNYRYVVLALTGIVLVGAVVAARHRRSPNAATWTVQVQAPVESTPQQPSSITSSNIPPVADESNGTTAATEQATTAASGSIEPAASAPPDTTRVTLDIKPIDARVYYLGRLQPGPPFEFDIAKGQRIAVEVVRFGFVTAKVVIDDRKPVINFGMLRERYRPKPE